MLARVFFQSVCSHADEFQNYKCEEHLAMPKRGVVRVWFLRHESLNNYFFRRGAQTSPFNASSFPASI